jgi:transposase
VLRSALQLFVSVDGANAQLDIALRPGGERWSIANDDAGIAALVERLQARPPTLIVLEATGGYQRSVVAALAGAGLPVAAVNPRPARDVATATGQLAKTEARDARALAHVAEAVRPTPRPLPDALADELRALLTRRRPRVARRTAEQNRLGSTSPRLQTDIQAHSTWLNTRLAALDDDLDMTLLIVFYERVLAAGQTAKVALAACMRKLLTILNAMLKHHTPWQPQVVLGT